jgi:hypothetical protein
MRPPRRPGQSSIFALIALPVMLGVLVLVLVLLRQRDTSTELRNAAVAAALASADELADDPLLTDDPEAIRPLLERARTAAGGVGGKNLVEGRPLAIDPPADGKAGDLEFGFFTPGVDTSFRPLKANAGSAEWGKVDAVRLTARHPWRDTEFTRLTAVFDRHLAGFRPHHDRPAPLVPVALYDGPHEQYRTPWAEAAANPDGPDEVAFARGRAHPFLPGADGLREVRVRVGWQKEKADGVVCGFPVRMAGVNPKRAAAQVTTGVTDADLKAVGGELALTPAGTLSVEGDPGLFGNVDPDDDRPLKEFRKLAASGEARVWPVFRELDDDGRVVLVGFTAARVVEAEREPDTGALLLTLQPAVLATPTAVTHPDRPVRDRTVGRVRIAG